MESVNVPFIRGGEKRFKIGPDEVLACVDFANSTLTLDQGDNTPDLSDENMVLLSSLFAIFADDVLRNDGRVAKQVMRALGYEAEAVKVNPN